MNELYTLDDFKALHGRLIASRDIEKPTIVIPAGTCGQTSGANDIIRLAKREILKKGLTEKIRLRITGCNGFCQTEPSVLIEPERTFYPNLDNDRIVKIIDAVAKGMILNEFLYRDPLTNQTIQIQDDIPFFAYQQRTLLVQNEKVDPIRIYNYIEIGGYTSLVNVLENYEPTQVINVIVKSQLRGRGGAGFPTGRKWQLLSQQPGPDKIIICNADEGDPGAYMDRSLIEGNPHSIIEGMIIGAFATGANEGIIYVRNEYPLAIKHLMIALRQARELGILGANILGSHLSFDIRLIRGAGAFVCGEETALMHSVEGKVGEPRQRPPYPVQKGVEGKPTIINNVETWANIPIIIGQGAKTFAHTGTKNNSGTKIFSLVGKIKNTGLVEVPMGTPLNRLVYDIGDGSASGLHIKAVQTGGPSGGCIPAHLFNIPIDYDSLSTIGSMMGSGGMIVMDQDTCMVDIAKYFMNFLRDESCGKCLSCREGTQRMWELLDKITQGKGTMQDLEVLEDIAIATRDASMCGLGQSAANPVLSTLRHFKDEYVSHIKYKQCPAAVCSGIISSPCQHVCPIDTEAPQYIAYIARGEFDKAYDIILKDNPLFGCVSRVCNHPCELKCRAKQGGEAISIRALKRAAIEYGSKKIPATRVKRTGPKVAIIGSGPSGLTAAYELAEKGYAPTVFEGESIAGGMLALTIPEYRLPRHILQTDIQRIINSGVTIETNKKLGEDFTIQSLDKNGFKAIYLAMGAHKSLKLAIPNEEAKGVIPAMQFLKSVHLGKKIAVGRNVAVIGGGNSAVDAARIALRLKGVEKVAIIYRRTRAEMPAYNEEIDSALEEGIDIKYLTAPTKVVVKYGKVTGLECVTMKLGEMDDSGRRRPIPIENSKHQLKIDTMITAIGEQPELSGLSEANNFNTTDRNTLMIDPETLSTNIKGVFAGGDVVRGPGTVIEAMADGKKVACLIDKYIKGENVALTYKITKPSVYVDPIELQVEELLDTHRERIPRLPVQDRSKNFKEVDCCLSKAAAIREAKRCLRCDLEAKREDDSKEIQ